jgi:hypothetical protein
MMVPAANLNAWINALRMLHRDAPAPERPIPNSSDFLCALQQHVESASRREQQVRFLHALLRFASHLKLEGDEPEGENR